MENNEIKYVLKWTNQCDDKFIDDFLHVENMVFGGFTKKLFENKYLHNIYGPSLITIAYLNNKPVAADSMIRNDYNGIAYQSADTCVLEECRGKGVFSQMKKREIEILGEDKTIFGFPNGNSFPGFVKMGWTIQCRLYPALFLFPSLFDKENPALIDVEYAKWLKKTDRKFFYIKICKKHYLILQGQKHFQMVGRIEPESAMLFERKKHPGIIRFRSKKKRFFNDNGYSGSIITYGKIPFDIPYWKVDTLLN
ncbi:MAG: GNAT family N-acetyltransferase [bacterium]|nr:GNAT family N-acetyltransferase [Candidatus Limimorpha caballi]